MQFFGGPPEGAEASDRRDVFELFGAHEGFPGLPAYDSFPIGFVGDPYRGLVKAYLTASLRIPHPHLP
jgi:hypothetical protein